MSTVLVRDKRIPANGTRRILASEFDAKVHEKIEDKAAPAPAPVKKQLNPE